MLIANVSPRDASIEVASAKALGARVRAWIFLPLLVAALLAAGYEAYLALRSPGEVIRSELTAAGSALQHLSWSTPNDSVQHAIAEHFTRHAATVDAKGFPVYVTVTLHDLGRAACLDARRVARRIEGPVVIVVDRRTDAETCGDDTAMTWRLMP